MTLKSIREEAGYTIEEFAEILKLQPYGLQLLESKGTSGAAAVKTFGIYCEKAGVNPADFLGNMEVKIPFSFGSVDAATVVNFKGICKAENMTYGAGFDFLVDFYLANVLTFGGLEALGLTIEDIADRLNMPVESVECLSNANLKGGALVELIKNQNMDFYEWICGKSIDKHGKTR